MTIRSRFVPIAICLMVGLAACGDDGASTATDETAATDTTAATETTAATDTTVGEATDVLKLAVTDRGMLVDGDGFTLYVFTEDSPGVSTCTGACAEAWPPVIAPAGGTSVGDLPALDFGVVLSGSGQVTYLDQPLYYYAGDSAPGDRNGEGVGGVWFAVTIE